MKDGGCVEGFVKNHQSLRQSKDSSVIGVSSEAETGSLHLLEVRPTKTPIWVGFPPKRLFLARPGHVDVPRFALAPSAVSPPHR